jgi:hypothetical protein
VPVLGISIVWFVKLSDTILLVEVIDPEKVPLTETETGTLLPIGSGPVSVICKVKVVICVANAIEVLFFTPEKATVPRVGFPFVVMLVDACGV